MAKWQMLSAHIHLALQVRLDHRIAKKQVITCQTAPPFFTWYYRKPFCFMFVTLPVQSLSESILQQTLYAKKWNSTVIIGKHFDRLFSNNYIFCYWTFLFCHMLLFSLEEKQAELYKTNYKLFQIQYVHLKH